MSLFIRRQQTVSFAIARHSRGSQIYLEKSLDTRCDAVELLVCLNLSPAEERLEIREALLLCREAVFTDAVVE